MASSVKLAIASELLHLRKAPGPLTAAKMVQARAIVRGLGNDDPAVALRRLVDLAREHADDRDVDAALASLGWGIDAVTVADRLNEYASPRYVDARTVRRWADEGLKKLVLLILGTEPWIQPVARLTIRQVGAELRLALTLTLPPNLRMDAPELTVNDETVEVALPAIEARPIEQSFFAGFQPFAQLDDLPVEIHLRWFGEKYPRYESVAQGSEQIAIVSTLGFSGLRVAVRRLNEAR